MGRLDSVLKVIEGFMAVLAGLLLIFITLSMCVSIALRTMNLQTPLWSVQFNEYSLLWIAMLGGGWLLRREKHVSLDTVTRRLKGGGLKRLRVFHAFLGLLICAILAYYTGAVTWDNLKRGVLDVRAVDIPKYLILSVVFFGFSVMAMEFFRMFVVAIKSLRKEP